MLAPILISLADFIADVELGLVFDVFSLQVGSEKRVYGRCVRGQSGSFRRFVVVYAVVL